MKQRRILSLALALVLALSLAAPAMAVDDLNFPDVPVNAYYRDAVSWAVDKGVVNGYVDGMFRPDKSCTQEEAAVMLWRAAGSKPSLTLDASAGEFALAEDWLIRTAGRMIGAAQRDVIMNRLTFVYILYASLGGLAVPAYHTDFTDLSAADYTTPAVLDAVNWAVSRGIINGVGDGLFAPEQPLSRAQVVTMLYRLLHAENRYKVDFKTVPLYVNSVETKQELPLAFIDGKQDIPYISVQDAATMLMQVFATIPEIGPNYHLDVYTKDNRAGFLRENGFSMELNFDSDTVYFLDFDGFRQFPNSKSLLDFVYSFEDSDGNYKYLKPSFTFSARYGRDLTMDLGAYGIDLVRQGDGYYIPLQFLSDAILNNASMPILFNGQGCFIGDITEMGANGATVPTELGKLYYAPGPSETLSDALVRFNYNELCFFLDHFYGLKQQHDIRSFHELFMMTGLADDLLSGDPYQADFAIQMLTGHYMDDRHSGHIANSYRVSEADLARFNPEDPEDVASVLGSASLKAMRTRNEFKQTRAQFYPEGVPLYEEIGDTAYITFDAFLSIGDPSVNYYEQMPDENAADTYGQMIYCFNRITREGSPVKNVVLDLSGNGGGSVDAADYVLAMMLSSGTVSVKEQLTGATVTQLFNADLNMDGVFDNNDTLANRYNLYCLTSFISFSCGNLVPSVLKESGTVTILGQTSGGGACSVLRATTAVGTVFQISSPYCISYVSNGSFYDVDQGVTPHYYLKDFASFYDRALLTDYIHSLL